MQLEVPFPDLPRRRHQADGGIRLVATVSFEQCRSRLFQRDWQELVGQSDNLYAQYQSPEWFAHLQESGDAGLLPPMAVYDERGRVVGVVPLRISKRQLPFAVRGRVVWRSTLRAVSLLGSQPLLAPDDDLHDRVFATISAAEPSADGLYLHSVPTDGFLWTYVHRSRWLQSAFRVYVPGGRRSFHCLELPESFDTYLEKFGAKKRYNLRRQVRILAAEGGGELRARRIESPDDVPAFLDAIRAVTPRSWQGDARSSRIDRARRAPDTYADVARRGLLRSYVLECGTAAIAFVLGYQYRDVYHYAEIGYDARLARFSPGAVLLFLLVEDLMLHRPPRVVNFGIGDAQYKREFGTVERSDASIFLLRRTIPNRLRVAVHEGLTALRARVKRVIE